MSGTYVWLPEWLREPLVQQSRSTTTWLVGGAIRDRLLGLSTVDYDFAVEEDACRLARRVANQVGGHYFTLDVDRDTGRVILPNVEGGRVVLDFARLRGSDIEEDLRLRDFTLNALAIDLNIPEKLIDPTGGLQDLKDGVIRTCSPDAIRNDPIRGLRAVRMALLFEYHILPETLDLLRAAANEIPGVSAERIRDELFRIFALDHPGRAVRLMDHLGQIQILFPELDRLRGLEQPDPHEFTAWDHTLAVMDHLGGLISVLGRVHVSEEVSQLAKGEIAYRLGRYREAINDYLDLELSLGRHIRQIIYLGALFHDAGKSKTHKVVDDKMRFLGHEQISAKMVASQAVALQLSNSETQWLELLVSNYTLPAILEEEPDLDKRTIYRFIHQTGSAGVGVIILSIADLLGRKNPPIDQEALADRVSISRKLLDAYFEAPSDAYDPIPLIRGDELAEALGIEPGPIIGYLLEGIREGQVCGEVETREDAINLAAALLQGDSD
ncbi:MAG: HDIG domain-containing protein [Anaerolineales bacterium]|nr:HDIG domain-containing protein [Anaerolineales bacterium]